MKDNDVHGMQLCGQGRARQGKGQHPVSLRMVPSLTLGFHLSPLEDTQAEEKVSL